MIRTLFPLQRIRLHTIFLLHVLSQIHRRSIALHILFQADNDRLAPVPELFGAFVALSDEKVIDFFESPVRCLRVEKVDQGDEGEVGAHEDEICFPGKLGGFVSGRVVVHPFFEKPTLEIKDGLIMTTTKF